MAVTIAPATEAMQAIVDQINGGGAFELAVAATYSENIVDPLEEITALRVDVVSETEEQLNETLDIEDRTSHLIRVWVRKKMSPENQDQIDYLKLLHRQIFQRLNNFDSLDGRVKIWEIENDAKECPIKSILQQLGVFAATLVMRVEVEASYA
tara:strand:- start:3834 stop:4292 length:459 start_codon:yes stop_codon:yes gene_type:complete